MAFLGAEYEKVHSEADMTFHLVVEPLTKKRPDKQIDIWIMHYNAVC